MCSAASSLLSSFFITNTTPSLMKIITSFSAILTLALLAAPLTSWAQDPAAEFKVVQQLRAEKKPADALKHIEKVLAFVANPNSRVGSQFAYFAPFFLWQKGGVLCDMGDYDKACEVYKDINTNPAYKDRSLIESSKVLPGWDDEGYAPLLTMALFQQGLTRYQQATGSNGKPGNPEAYEQCIPLLEDYLKLYETNKVSRREKKMKLDGQVCVLLLQSYLLKKSPDFTKAAPFMERMGKAKAALPDDLVMNALGTVMRIATENPQYIEWGSKMIDSNPGSFHVAPHRIAPFIGNLYNFGVRAVQLAEEGLKAGNMDQALAAMRTANTIFGIMPDTVEARDSLMGVVKLVGGSSRPVVDKAMGISYSADRSKSYAESLTQIIDDNTQLEAYTGLSLANSAMRMGSSRLAKAGIKLIIERYPHLRQKDKELRDVNYLQYSQLCRATGDDETALKYEEKINPENVGKGNKNVVAINKMIRLTKEKQWDRVIPVANEVLAGLSKDADALNYVSACFTKIAANYYLKRMEEVVREGTELFNSGLLTAKADGLTPEQVRNYEPQAMYFVMDAYKELGAKDPKNYDKAIAIADSFTQKYPSINLEDNAMAPNVYFDAITVLLKRRGHGKEAEDKADLKKALVFCDVIAKNWKDHELYPTSRLLAGSILINGEDDAVKPQGIEALEQCVEAALKLPEGKGRAVASNALFWLASYAPEYPREGEDEAALAARVKGYFDTFWNQVDAEGDDYALQMASLQLSRSLATKDPAAYESALANAQKVIAREAAYYFKNDIHNPELELTINSYVESYVNGEKDIHNKVLTLEEKTEHLTNFPGIDPQDKYTNAILRMALLNSMNEAMVSAKRAGKTEEATNLERDIARSFRQMRDAFKPDDLTNFICVQVGNFEINYARRFRPGSPERKQEVEVALTYFSKVLERAKDYQNEANLGKAQALSLSDDPAAQQQALTLFSKLASAQDPAVVGPALIGLTDLNMNTGNYKGAVESAGKFMNVRGGGTPRERLEMMLKLAEAFCASGEVQKGIQTYVNLYSQNRGNISFSAPAVKGIMTQLWKRNTPASGDRLQNTFKQSDHWRAWNTGRDYVNQIRRAGIDKKMSPSERDLFNEVVLLVEEYAKDGAVQREEKEKNDFQSKLGK